MKGRAARAESAPRKIGNLKKFSAFATRQGRLRKRWCAPGAPRAHRRWRGMRERLSNAQYRFLRQMEKQPADVGKDEKRLADVEPLVLARWLASPPFKRRLEKTLLALRQRRE